MKKILVTGGTGFVGSHLVRALLDAGHHVLITGTQGEQTSECGIVGYQLVDLDWSKLEALDATFHLAANNDTLDLDYDRQVKANWDEPTRMFFKLQERGCKNFVYASSCAVYGDSPAPYIEGVTKPKPLNPYGTSKAMFDENAMEFSKTSKVKIVGLRYSNVYGPGEEHKGRRSSMIHQILSKIRANESVSLFKYGEQQRDWVYIKDVIAMNLAALEYKDSGIFNCGSGEARSFNDIVGIMNNLLNKNVVPTYIDNPCQDRYQNHTQCCMEKAAKLMNFKPSWKLEDGLKDFVSSTCDASQCQHKQSLPC